MTLDELNALPADSAAETLGRCCGARAWIARMVAARPYARREALFAASDAAWSACTDVDFREAFTHHPRIGDAEGLARRFATTRDWAAAEQRGVAGADRGVLERLAQGNTRYEARFGHVFIVCATGMSAAEMLAMLEARLQNEPGTELAIAAAEEHRITRLRLEKLLA